MREIEKIAMIKREKQHRTRRNQCGMSRIITCENNNLSGV